MGDDQDQDVPPPCGGELDELLIFGDPETRRKFLKRMAGTGVALTVGPSLLGWHSLQAQEPAVPPTPSGAGADLTKVTLKINGKEHVLDIDPRVSLLDALREHLNLTGSKKGCDHGQCGACTVLVNGRRINSCLSLALMHDGDEITTIEGLAQGDNCIRSRQRFSSTMVSNAAIARPARSVRPWLC